MTSIPIDYRNRPWRVKYIIDETFLLNEWMIFGTYPDGTVGVSDGQTEILEHVPREVAQEIVFERQKFCDFMRSKLCNFNEDGHVSDDHPLRTVK